MPYDLEDLCPDGLPTLEVSAEALRHNVRVVAAQARRPVWAVLKCDAYGLSAVLVAHALKSLPRGVLRGFAVGTVEEGESVRLAVGLHHNILVLDSPTSPRENKRYWDAGLTAVLGERALIDEWTLGTYHVAVDTGWLLPQGGLLWNDEDDWRSFGTHDRQTGGCSGILAHHPHGGDLAQERLRRALHHYGLSRGEFRHPEWCVHRATGLELWDGEEPGAVEEHAVRSGACVYGIQPPKVGEKVPFRPVARLLAPISRIEPGSSRHLTLGYPPAGYTSTEDTAYAWVGLGAQHGYETIFPCVTLVDPDRSLAAPWEETPLGESAVVRGGWRMGGHWVELNPGTPTRGAGAPQVVIAFGPGGSPLPLVAGRMRGVEGQEEDFLLRLGLAARAGMVNRRLVHVTEDEARTMDTLTGDAG